MNAHDDQFSFAQVCLSVGMALVRVTFLTKKRWFINGACAFSRISIHHGRARFFPWSLPSGLRSRVLG